MHYMDQIPVQIMSSCHILQNRTVC